jgi:hypothetical protein
MPKKNKMLTTQDILDDNIEKYWLKSGNPSLSIINSRKERLDRLNRPFWFLFTKGTLLRVFTKLKSIKFKKHYNKWEIGGVTFISIDWTLDEAFYKGIEFDKIIPDFSSVLYE